MSSWETKAICEKAAWWHRPCVEKVRNWHLDTNQSMWTRRALVACPMFAAREGVEAPGARVLAPGAKIAVVLGIVDI